MVLGIDASQANRKIKSGTEWYAFYLIQEFKKLLSGKSDVTVRLYTRDELEPELAKNLPANFETRILSWPFPYFWGQIRLSWEMLVSPPDILFCPAHTIPLVHPQRTFTTLHDVGFEDYPELYDPLSRWYHRFAARRAVKKAYHIFTVSEFSRERIIENYGGGGGLQGKITVTRLGVDKNYAIAYKLSSLEKYGLREKNYLLYVGRLEPKKNILNMVKAFEMAEIDMPFVLAGRRVNIQNVDNYLVDDPKLKDKIKFIDYVSQEDKVALYQGTAVFLFPTLYEGFGLPILEAQAAGVPVITSNTASNSEIAGEGAVIVDPESPYEIAQAIKRLASDEKLRSDKIKAGYENIKRFSWEECAKKTLEKIITSPQPSPRSEREKG